MSHSKRGKSTPPAGEQVVTKVAGKDLLLHEMQIDALVASEYNPRKLSFKEERELKNSLTEFGFVDPVIVNQHPERMNVLVGGHQRVAALKSLGFTAVMAVHVVLDPAQEKELNLRLNRGGDWDFDKMAQFFSPDEMDKVGFSLEEIKVAFPTFGEESTTKKAGGKGTAGAAAKAGSAIKATAIPMSPVVDKTADYLFVQIRDVEELEALQTRLGLDKVQESTKRHKGIRHILSGSELLAALN